MNVVNQEEMEKRYKLVAALERAIQRYCAVLWQAQRLKNEKLFMLTVAGLDDMLAWAWSSYHDGCMAELQTAFDCMGHIEFQNAIALADELDDKVIKRLRLKVVK